MRGLIKDLMILGGVASIGYGVWLYEPWMSFVVTGALALLIGLFMPIAEKKRDAV